MNFLIINGKYIKTLEKLKECFMQEEAKQIDSDLFKDLRDNFLDGDIDSFLRNVVGELELADRISKIEKGLSDSELMQQLIYAFTEENAIVEFDPFDYVEIVQQDIIGSQAILQVRILRLADEELMLRIVQQGCGESQRTKRLSELHIGAMEQTTLGIDPNGGEVVFILGKVELEKKSPMQKTTSPTSKEDISSSLLKNMQKFASLASGRRPQEMDDSLANKGKERHEHIHVTQDGLVVSVNEDVSINLLFVKGDKFIMGAQSTDESRPNYYKSAKPYESRVHEVRLSSFYIGEVLVSQALWRAVMRPEQLQDDNEISRRDVEIPKCNVKWRECQDFIEKLNKRLDMRFRLPSEAEWEYAARNSAFIKQDSMTEWCYDWFGRYPKGFQIDPFGPPSGDKRVVRGGNGWWFYRQSRNPIEYSEKLGFRLVLPKSGMDVTQLEYQKPNLLL